MRMPFVLCDFFNLEDYLAHVVVEFSLWYGLFKFEIIINFHSLK